MKRLFTRHSSPQLSSEECNTPPLRRYHLHRHLPGYRWYRRQLKKSQERQEYNRTQRDAEEHIPTPSSPSSNTFDKVETHTFITPHTSQLKRLITLVALVCLIVSSVLLIGAITDLIVNKPGAVSSTLCLILFTAVWYLLWRRAEQVQRNGLSGHIFGRVTHVTRRMHETLGFNVEVLSLTVTPLNVRSGPIDPLSVEMIGLPISGEITDGKTIFFTAQWRKDCPIRVTHILNVTDLSEIRAQNQILVKTRFWEGIFFALVGLSMLLFLAVIRRRFIER